MLNINPIQDDPGGGGRMRGGGGLESAQKTLTFSPFTTLLENFKIVPSDNSKLLMLNL